MNLSDLDVALSRLTAPERRALTVAAAELRDRCVGAGAHRLAAVWSALAVAGAEAGDREAAAFAALMEQLGPWSP